MQSDQFPLCQTEGNLKLLTKLQPSSLLVGVIRFIDKKDWKITISFRRSLLPDHLSHTKLVRNLYHKDCFMLLLFMTFSPFVVEIRSTSFTALHFVDFVLCSFV